MKKDEAQGGEHMFLRHRQHLRPAHWRKREQLFRSPCRSAHRWQLHQPGRWTEAHGDHRAVLLFFLFDTKAI